MSENKNYILKNTRESLLNWIMKVHNTDSVLLKSDESTDRLEQVKSWLGNQ